MPHYMVFQQQLTDEQIDAVNLGQYGAEATAYFKLLSLSESMAQKRVDVANSLGLYRMTAVANAKDLEELFNVGNGYPTDPIIDIHTCQAVAWWHQCVCWQRGC
jgi:hypothetical protein